jgi:hypothetical protein
MPIRFSGVSSRLISLVDISELKAIQDTLRLASLTDGLTGAYNRRYLLQKLGEEIERAKRYGNELSVDPARPGFLQGDQRYLRASGR